MLSLLLHPVPFRRSGTCKCSATVLLPYAELALVASRRAAGDARIQPPILPVENHPSCRTNAQQEPVLPNDHAWRPDLVLTLLVSRLLSQADSALDMPVRSQQLPRM